MLPTNNTGENQNLRKKLAMNECNESTYAMNLLLLKKRFPKWGYNSVSCNDG